jgi:hypothetical protein
VAYANLERTGLSNLSVKSPAVLQTERTACPLALSERWSDKSPSGCMPRRGPSADITDTSRHRSRGRYIGRTTVTSSGCSPTTPVFGGQ